MRQIAITLLLFGILSTVVYADEYLIVPGKSVGNLALGSYSADYIEGWLGSPAGKTREDGGIRYIYDEAYGFNLWFSAGYNILDKIYIWHGEYKTKDGFGIGSFVMDIEKYYPGYYSGEFYMSRGIGFNFDKNTGKVKMICVYR